MARAWISRRTGKALSAAYQHRLEARGITYQEYRRGANLTEARGHPSPRPAGAAPKDLVERLVRGEGSPQDYKDLAKKFTRPAWVPTWAATDVAAALSQLPDPKRWESVEFTPRGDGQPWTMTVHLKGNAYDREILIPGGGGPGSGAKEVLQIVTELEYKQRDQYEKRRRAAEAIFFDVLGSDDEA